MQHPASVPQAASSARAASLLLAACLVACGSNGSDDSNDGRGSGRGGMAGIGGGNSGAGLPLACRSDVRFHLVGNVAGEQVDVTEAPTTGGFSQQSNPPGPHFRVPHATSGDEEQLVVVYLTWSDAVVSGEITAIEGWVRLPLGGPLPGETLCAGAGSEMMIPRDEDETTLGEFQFRLLELSGGTDCSEPLSGELQGCWRN